MRKRITSEGGKRERFESSGNWLNLGDLAQVELSSEDASHPIEAALEPGSDGGWRADAPGKQTIRLLFDTPLKISRIELLFREKEQSRTQEFALSWAASGDPSTREIVRQQYNFSPDGDTLELEDYEVALDEVAVLELTITPDISGGAGRASLEQLRIAG